MYGSGSCFLKVKSIKLGKLATSKNRKSDEIPLETMVKVLSEKQILINMSGSVCLSADGSRKGSILLE